MSNTDWIDRQEYPFASHYLEVPAGRLHYVDEGSGPAIVMGMAIPRGPTCIAV